MNNVHHVQILFCIECSRPAYQLEVKYCEIKNGEKSIERYILYRDLGLCRRLDLCSNLESSKTSESNSVLLCLMLTWFSLKYNRRIAGQERSIHTVRVSNHPPIVSCRKPHLVL